LTRQPSYGPFNLIGSWIATPVERIRAANFGCNHPAEELARNVTEAQPDIRSACLYRQITFGWAQ
jgi:hypothetical protein